MATNLKDLCRLCAKRDEFSKDLMDETNKNVLKLIQDFIQIAVTENDDLPTKVCLVCEEKMISFQLFVLECYNVQDSLRKLQLESSSNMQIKLEDDIADFNFPLIKSEVKDELTAEDIVSAIKNDALPDFDGRSYDDDDDEDIDDIAIASLKEMKKQPSKRKVLRKVKEGSVKKKLGAKDESVKRKNLIKDESPELSAILKQPNLQVKDFVKLQCNICRDVVKTWSGLRIHYFKTHKSKPYVTCICGFIIRSKSVLYKHVSDHKLESRKIRKDLDNEDNEDEAKYSNLNVKDFVTFTCPCCDIQCSSWYSLKAHCEVKHEIQPVVQCVCGITLKSKSVLYKHIQDHKNPNVIICDKCPRITKTIAAMNKHKMRHVPKMDRRFCCDSCDKIFTTKDALKSHERSHVPIEERKIYRCDICDMKFTTRSSAASHKRVVHDKIKSYVCDLCGYACGTNGELRQHRAIHSDDKPFVCKKCGKPFKTYSNLKTHMDTHEDTSYACFVCNRVLNSRRTLRKHLLVHEDKCRHVCSYCNKAFKRRQTLKVHMYTHTGDKPLTCKWCDERFAYASTLRSHRLRCHPDKMGTQTHDTYALYSHVNNAVQEEYLKNDVQAVGVAKNEVEAM